MSGLADDSVRRQNRHKGRHYRPVDAAKLDSEPRHILFRQQRVVVRQFVDVLLCHVSADALFNAEEYPMFSCGQLHNPRIIPDGGSDFAGKQIAGNHLHISAHAIHGFPRRDVRIYSLH